MDAITKTSIESMNRLGNFYKGEIATARAQSEHHGRLMSMMKATMIIQRVEAQGGGLPEAIRLLQEEVDKLN